MCSLTNVQASEHVRGIATLGAPHASPPATVPDQTRGTIPNVNRRAPGAYYASNGTFYVTVTSNRVVGDAAGDAAARNAFTSYSLVLGVHRVVASNAKDCSLQHIALQPPICD